MKFSPSPYQEAVFNWIKQGRGNAVINAVAGSGKTTTLVEVAKMLPAGTAIFVAFNKIIVEELNKRLPSNVPCKTIHALGLRTLYDHYQRKSEMKEEKYTVLTSPHAAHIHSNLEAEYLRNRNEYDVFKEKERKTSTITHGGAWDRYANLTVGDLAKPVPEPFPPPPTAVIAQQLKEVVRYMRLRLVNYYETEEIKLVIDQFALDVDFPLEMLYQAIPKILNEGITVANEQGVIDFDDMLWLPYIFDLRPPTFDWVLVDEVQDLNPAQINFVFKLERGNGRSLFVGDPKQAIYGFAGADDDSFYQIKECRNAIEFPLSICYRCPKNVVELARELVPTIECHPDASDGHVGEVEIETLSEELRKSDFVVCRFTAPLISLCIDLIGKRMAAKVLGRDIGFQLAQIIRGATHLKGYNYDRFLEYLRKYQDIRISKLRDYKDAEERIRSIEDRVQGVVRCYESFKNCIAAEDLIKEIDKLFSDSLSPITLSTIHKAKGREFDRVFILDFEGMPLEYDGQQDWQLQQEKNLKYVSITRAKRELYLVSSKKSNSKTTSV